MKSHFSKYKPEIKKLTKSNSLLVNGRIFYIVKKDENGKDSKMFYCVYDYETKIKIGFFQDKKTIEDELIKLFKKENIYDKLDLFFERIDK